MSYFKRLREKAADKWRKSYASSYWYDDYERSWDAYDRYYKDMGYQPTQIQSYKKSANLYRLASVRRAIANFVHIVTGKNIPVTYATKGDSYTDGKRVILSADVDDNFDVSVGLALHEGSHIILSDFDMLKDMNATYDTHEVLARKTGGVITEGDFNNTGKFHVGMYAPEKRRIFHPNGDIHPKCMVSKPIYDTIMNLTNWIEDRRIDHYIYTSAPGYRTYYVSLYDHYFNDAVVTKGIVSGEFTDETIESYLFRIINLLNEKSDLTKLNGLKRIHQILNLKNIARLKTTKDSLNLAIDVMVEILNNVSTFEMKQPTSNPKANGEDGDDGEPIEIGDDEIDNLRIGKPAPGMTTRGAKLSKTALKQLLKKYENQKDFLNGIIKKKTVSKEENTRLDAIDEAGTEIQRVGVDADGRYGKISKGVDCVVVKKLTQSVIESEDFPITSRGYDGEMREFHREHVERGVQLGTILGKKLQVRSESRETIFNRLNKGKIDKRLIASLGYENEGVFYTHHVDNYKRANIHISLDYSGSMSGTKLDRTITSTVAIVKACLMARNIDVQVSVRTTSSGSPNLPWIGLIYDSRRDNFRTFCKHMSMFNANHTTPEGLCFEAIQKYLIPHSNDVDSYFLNFSDGQPAYSIHRGGDDFEYGGMSAAKHTAKQVQKMREAGIKVLSYFITEYPGDRFESTSDWQIFKTCYGTDARYINVENMMEVARSMNEMFLKK